MIYLEKEKIINLIRLSEFKQKIIKLIPTKTSQLQNDSGFKTTDNNTWEANTANSDGYVIAGSGHANQVWKTDANGVPGWRADANTTYGAATQSANGLMLAADKKKLDGVATGANKYIHPTASGNKHIPSGGSSGQILRWSADGTAVWGDESSISEFEGTLPISKGGTGKTTAQDAFNVLFRDIADARYFLKTEGDALKKSVSDGKAEVASAITEKGVTTAADAGFATMAANVGKIETCHQWKNTANGSYKFVQNGDRWIANNRGVNSSTATSTWEVTVPADTTAYIGWRTDTESPDKLSITLNGTTVLSSTGGIKASETVLTLNLVAGENTLIATYIKDSSVHACGDMAYVVLPPVGEQPGQYKYQSKYITPSTSSQAIYPDSGYDGLYSVSVAATIASGNFKSGSGTFPSDSSTISINIGFTPKILVIFGINSDKTYGNVTVYNSYFENTKEYRMNLLANFSSNYVRIVNTIGSANAIIKSIGSTTVLSRGNDIHIESQPMTWYAFE